MLDSREPDSALLSAVDSAAPGEPGAAPSLGLPASAAVPGSAGLSGSGIIIVNRGGNSYGVM